jgi:hypothetical protein
MFAVAVAANSEVSVFNFDATSRQRAKRPTVTWADPPDPAKLPIRLITAALLGATAVAALLIDDACQFDPVLERSRLEQKLETLRIAGHEVADRREMTLALDKEADADPGIIQKKRLPPVWKLPMSYDSVEHWHKTAARRVRRADEELKRIADEEALTKSEITNLPPPEAKRVSLLRRLMHAVLGDLPPDPED